MMLGKTKLHQTGSPPLFLPLPCPRLPSFPSPLLLFIISLHSYVIIGLGKEFQGCRLSEQYYAELSSRVISDANTCPPGECELSLLVSVSWRWCIWSQTASSLGSWGQGGGTQGTPLQAFLSSSYRLQSRERPEQSAPTSYYCPSC